MESDLTGICEIENSSFTEPYPRFLLRRLLRDHSGRFFVAQTTEGKLVGYCVASTNQGSAHLISIAVSPDQRRIKIAVGLMETLMEHLMDQGIEEIWLELKLGNKEALGLYTKLGFRKVSVVPNYYSDRSDALRMRRILGATVGDQ
jgi:ribosomal-protein-alanine N-acetyltransferase